MGVMITPLLRYFSVFSESALSLITTEPEKCIHHSVYTEKCILDHNRSILDHIFVMAGHLTLNLVTLV